MIKQNVSAAVHCALVACAVSLFSGTAVLAQNAPASGPQDQNQSSATTTELGKVEVTGTRIKQTSVATAQPVTIITAAQIQSSGFATVGEVLQNIPQAGAFDTNADSGNGTNTSTTIDLRYLGSNRTLVLVNGKRWAGGSVNLNTIPSSIIDHVEVLQDGASAIYGSDAIAGVVNIITKKNFDGAEANAYMGIYDNDYGGIKSWDGKKQNYNITMGTSNAKGGVLLNLAYTETNPVWTADRAQSRDNPHWTQENTSASANPIGVFTLQSPQLAGKTFGDVTCPASGTCNFGISQVPTNDPALDGFTNATALSTFTITQFLSPTESQSIYLAGHYNIADNLTFNAVGAYNDFMRTLSLSPVPMGIGAGGRYSAPGGTGVGIGANNPYNPFGVDLVGNLSQYCPDGHTLGGVAVASCEPNYLLQSYLRVTNEIGPRIVNDTTGSQVYRLGFSGFFDALGNEWDWDAEYGYGKQRFEMLGQNVFSTDLLATSLDSPGFQPCNGPAQPAPGSTGNWQEINGQYYQILQKGCEPLNPFGGYDLATGQGSITPGQLSYGAAPVIELSNQISRDYTADITGQLLQLPAGPLSVAAGAEMYEQDYNYVPSKNLQDAGNTFLTTEPEQGRTTTIAEYAEINIPLLENVPFAKSMNVDLANRWSQFKWQGGEPNSGIEGTGIKHYTHATTGRAELRWQPDDSVLVRASWSQAFRLPSISDFYSAAGFGYNPLQDPCAPNTENGSWQQGTPLPPGCHGLVHSQPQNEMRSGGGGNPSLEPETSVSRSLGFVYSPDWLPGFNFNADYYHIEVDNLISGPTSSYILNQCYMEDIASFCNDITLTGNIITMINTSTTNLGAEWTDGVDVGASYAFPTTAVGNFRVSGQATFVRSFVDVVPSSTAASGWQNLEMAGYAVNGSSYGIPKLRANLSANWTDGNWSARWAMTYIGKIFESCSAKTIAMNECSEPDSLNEYTGTMGKNQLGTTIYHDVSLTYHVEPINTNLTFGILNLFNKQYPASLTSPRQTELVDTGYRVPGRFIYAQVGVKF